MSDATLHTPVPIRAAAVPRGRSRRLNIALTILLCFFLLTLFGPLLAPDDPLAQGALITTRLLPPLSRGPDAGTGSGPLFLLGTDPVGRDVLSRLLYGTRTSISLAITATAGSVFLGALIGLIAAAAGGMIDRLLTWLTDTFLALPSAFLVIVLAFALGTSIAGLMIVLILSGWMRIARIVRGEAVHLRRREFILAARLLGQPTGAIIRRHILPNILPTLLTAAILQWSEMLLAEAALGFLGFGVQLPAPSWGNMLGDALIHLEDAWWLALAPGLLLTILMSTLHIAAEEIQDARRS